MKDTKFRYHTSSYNEKSTNDKKKHGLTKIDLYQEFYSPNILAVASSLVGEDSLSHHIDTSIGVYIIDRYTYHALEFLERVTRDSK